MIPADDVRRILLALSPNELAAIGRTTDAFQARIKQLANQQQQEHQHDCNA